MREFKQVEYISKREWELTALVRELLPTTYWEKQLPTGHYEWRLLNSQEDCRKRDDIRTFPRVERVHRVFCLFYSPTDQEEELDSNPLRAARVLGAILAQDELRAYTNIPTDGEDDGNEYQ